MVFVIFGITGDLAKVMTFRSLYRLEQRGLLDEMLVVWGGEFGRTPWSQNTTGRDHNPGAMTVFMTGAGIEGGQHIGRTDDLGYKTEEQPVTNHDLHATLLHLLGGLDVPNAGEVRVEGQPMASLSEALRIAFAARGQ